ncbi:MAG: 50S ribosomal protein L24 [Candidatus Thermoplasmatota archaeon]|nr:50S ribosomal protein L24 [Candidatus Thermoplasmatota archaeon]
MAIKSIQPRKVRKYLFTAPLHKKRKMVSAHLAEELMLKYNLRSFPVRKGDTVKVMRGAFKGHIGKVASVDTKAGKVTLEGVTIAKSDKSQVPRPIHPSNLLITKLELSDPWRSKKLEKRKELVKVERKRKKKEVVRVEEKNEQTS